MYVCANFASDDNNWYSPWAQRGHRAPPPPPQDPPWVVSFCSGDTKFVFLGWPNAKIWAIQFSEDFDGGHFEKCPKRWGRPNLYGVKISIIDQWGPPNKMIPLMEDPGRGGGCTVTPLGPWTNIYTSCYIITDIYTAAHPCKYQLPEIY